MFAAKISWVVLCFALCSLLGNGSLAAQDASAAEAGSIIQRLENEAKAVAPLLKGEWTRSWVAQAGSLPRVEAKIITVGEKQIEVDEALFYVGRYGSPLAYARALDLAEGLGFEPQKGSKVLDFGYGSIGHLRMLALSGLEVTGVDVDPILPQLYENADGKLGKGSVKLLNGRFPADVEPVERAGEGYDLFISKNTLKRGYIHPAREPASPRHVIKLGVSDEAYLAAVAKTLKPRGYFVIYNFCPARAPADKPYIPWADGECPFSETQLEEAGFEVLAFDVVDDQAARKLAKVLGWDAQGMKLETDLFAWYTIARRR